MLGHMLAGWFKPRRKKSLQWNFLKKVAVMHNG